MAHHGARTALVDCAQDIRWTYAEFGAEVDRVAAALVGTGLAKGERVGIWAPNCAEWTVVQYATATVGLILVTINPAYRTHELDYVLRQAGVAYLFAVESFKTSDYRQMIEEVTEGLDDRAA